MQGYEQTVRESKNLAARMRQGTGAASLLHGQDAPTHYQDALERFQKDFASYEKNRRQEEKSKRQIDLEKKRIEQLERENRRWEVVQNYQQKMKERQDYGLQNQMLGIKRTANSNGLAYNPITLEYDKNPEGLKLKHNDEESKLRRYVRAHNMDYRGNSKYNPLTGQSRVGIEQVVPQQLNERFQNKLYDHYDGLRLKVPSEDSMRHQIPHNNYY